MTNDHTTLTDTTRRTVLKTIGGYGALAAVPTASAHEFNGDSSGDGTSSDHDHTDANLHGSSSNVELLDYHSLGQRGPSSTNSADNPHYGGISEMRVIGDYAYVCFFSSKDPTNNRGIGVIDISEFNAPDNTNDLRNAEMDFVAFVRNDNDAAAVMDLKTSADGDYVFYTKQPISALFDDPDPTPSTEEDSTGTLAGAITAVNVTDPENPTIAGTFAHDTGFHNCWHHKIGGTDYVFAIKDIELDGTSGVYVFEFDRPTGVLELVNTWNQQGNFADGNVTGGDTYIHDIAVQDDPRLESPVGYLSYWNAGVYALDLSNPTDISVLGHFTMSNAHYAEPAPTYFDGKRVLVAGHEYPSDKNGHTGHVKLLDADGLDDGYTKGEDNIVELDYWEWRDDVSYDGTYTFSPHNFTVTEGKWIHVGHYHGGTRFLRIDTENWSLTERGYFQAAKDVPEESKVVGLNHAAPFTWTAVTQNGVTYAADINTGIYALRYKPDSNVTNASVGVAGVVGSIGFMTLARRYGDDLWAALDALLST
ncbi:LVIVD repeat-containing protein [Haladaptatus halobius]|uniref:LVIVD repeat-containing protein n=1 Tax=Haladaptatus halobius TaxID=2884875 RepID=UPI001D09B69C|nr:hypothetical protein [Haladaptatus halobius]